MNPIVDLGLQETYPNMQVFEYRMNLATNEWITSPMLPSGDSRPWPPPQKALNRILVMWLDDQASPREHEIWIFCGLNLMPEEGYMYHIGRYRVDQEHETITCVQEIWKVDNNGLMEEQSMAMDYAKRMLPWLETYRFEQTCRAHQAAWPSGMELLEALLVGEVLTTNEHFSGEDYRD